MKKFITALSLLVVSTVAFAQDINKLISQTDITRIISTLAADNMQGRATFTPGIEKAARFIEDEYKQTGLLPLAGDAGYRQNFTMTRLTTIKTLVSINGKLIPQDSVYANTTEAALTWTNNGDVQIAKLEAGKNFITEYRAYLASGKKMLVLVDPQFTAIFQRIKEANRKGIIISAKTKSRSVVFVLGNHDDIKSFDVSYTGKSEQLPLFNIAGIIPGKTKPNEYVIFSGHYDHLGILPAVKGDSVANGAMMMHPERQR